MCIHESGDVRRIAIDVGARTIVSIHTSRDNVLASHGDNRRKHRHQTMCGCGDVGGGWMTYTGLGRAMEWEWRGGGGGGGG